MRLAGYYSIGSYLEKYHMEKVQTIERKLCHCHRERTYLESGFPYPQCCHLGRGGSTVYEYWKCIQEEMKKNYPDTMMEVYLLNIQDEDC